MKDHILSAYLKEFVEEFGLTHLTEIDAFEYFAAHSVISKHTPESFEPQEVVVGGSGDLGIDAIGIIVNDHPVLSNEAVDFLKGNLHRLDAQFIFIQAKTSPHFESGEMGTFISGVRQFFQQVLPTSANEAILALHKIKEHIFNSSIDMDQSPLCRLYYVTTGTWANDPAFQPLVEQCKTDLQKTGLFSSVEFLPIDAESLKRSYRELHRKITREIIFEKHTILPQIVNVQEAYIGIVPCQEYLKLILDDEGNLNRRLFYDNVRDFQGHNPVNTEIESTVQDSARNDRFALLNNGVTIVATEANKVGAIFRLKDFQIVNGCQTSHILYLNRKYLTPKVFLPIKLIITANVEVTNQIIQGTNRQTEVKLEAFESLAPFQKKLEEFYTAVGREQKERIYYERRSKQYDYLNLPKDHIITLSTQINSFVAMFLNEPQSTHRYYGELLTSYRNRLFSDSHSAMPYFLSGAALSAIERLFATGRLPFTWKRSKYQLLMVFRLQNQPFELPYLNNKKIDMYCQKLLDVLNQDSSLETAFLCAGRLVESVRSGMPPSRDPLERTRAFTIALVAASGKKEETAASAARMSGTVNWFSDTKGYGFITGDDKADYFVHQSNIMPVCPLPIVSGQRVKFTGFNTPRGLQAIDVEVIK